VTLSLFTAKFQKHTALDVVEGHFENVVFLKFKTWIGVSLTENFVGFIIIDF